MDALGGKPLLDSDGRDTQARTRRVFVRDLELLGSVGIYEHEQRYRQRVRVSVELDVRDEYDGRSDDIAGVYDYDLAIRAVKDIVASGHFNLLETLAESIAQTCLSDPRVHQIRVRIEKPNLVPSPAQVGIEIERRRADY